MERNAVTDRISITVATADGTTTVVSLLRNSTTEELVQLAVPQLGLRQLDPDNRLVPYDLVSESGVLLAPTLPLERQGVIDGATLRIVPVAKPGGDPGNYLLVAIQALGPNVAASALWDAVKYAWAWAHDGTPRLHRKRSHLDFSLEDAHKIVRLAIDTDDARVIRAALDGLLAGEDVSVGEVGSYLYTRVAAGKDKSKPLRRKQRKD